MPERLATIDFETYSEAGCVWDGKSRKWRPPLGATKKGISAVGAAAYAEHPSTEVLTLSYKIPGDAEPSRWRPGLPVPQRLLDYIAAGGLVEAHNVMFERLIWHYVLHLRQGWPDLPPAQLRCSMATAHVDNYPGALGNLSELLPVTVKKDKDGKRLLDKFSVPRNPTRKDPRTRIRPEEDPEDAERLYSYCDTDVLAEEEVSGLLPPMTEDELRFWQIDQEMNWRGLPIDINSVRNMMEILRQAQDRYGAEFEALTGGLKPSQVQAFRGWLAARGVQTTSLDAEALDELLSREDLPPDAHRAVQIRGLVGSASVKKLYAMDRSVSQDGRVRNTIIHHGARTGRPKGSLVQPLNMPKAGPKLVYCEACHYPSKPLSLTCPWCGAPLSPVAHQYKWPEHPDNAAEFPVDSIQRVMASRDLDTVEAFLGPPLPAIIGSMRGMICAPEGREFVSSDYSAIEAVVTAMLSGCQWRIDTFRRREDIYLASAASVKGLTVQYYLDYKAEHGSNHPDRQKVGKVAELALGFGGWLGAWRGFDPDGMPDDEVKKTILAWRGASPEIPELWGGQARGKPWMRDYYLERYGLEGAFVNAVQFPGQQFESHGLKFHMERDVLIITLLSGRKLRYHEPRLIEKDGEPGVFDIVYYTWNSNPNYGAMGWAPTNTYSGRLTENCVQAVAHDIQRFGIERLRDAGYHTVLPIYDENITEVPEGWGSIEELEALMSTMPPWAQGWPVRASGGWRGKRFRKD